MGVAIVVFGAWVAAAHGWHRECPSDCIVVAGVVGRECAWHG
jgi:hypothetical protein